jgi:hypothetical protein
MDKFLSIPVTTGGEQLVGLNDVLLVEVGDKSGANTTTVTTLFYNNNEKCEITHAAVAANSTVFRNWIQDEMTKALQSDWTNVARTAAPAYAVSAIAVSV